MTGFSSSEVESHPQLDTPLEREAGAETTGADTRMETQGAEEQGPDCILSRLGVTLNGGFLVPLKLWIQKVGTIIFPLWKLNGMPHADQEAREQPFPCPQCEKRYKTRKYLAEHIRGVHVREVRFACGICGKGFFWPTDFKIYKQRKMLCKPANSPVAPLPTAILSSSE
jgi:hypothetical protein